MFIKDKILIEIEIDDLSTFNILRKENRLLSKILKMEFQEKYWGN